MKKWKLIITATVKDSMDRSDEKVYFEMDVYKQLSPRLNQGFMKLRDGITIDFHKMQLEEENAD